MRKRKGNFLMDRKGFGIATLGVLTCVGLVAATGFVLVQAQPRAAIVQSQQRALNYDKLAQLSLKEAVASKAKHAQLRPLGEISIPSVGVYLPVYDGVSADAMISGAGTLYADQVMGHGNYGLISHTVFDADQLLFSPLNRLSEGTPVYVTDGSSVFTYVVDGVRTVSRSDVDALKGDGDRLTLVTCADVHAWSRLVVTCRLTETKVVTAETRSLFKGSYNRP